MTARRQRLFSRYLHRHQDKTVNELKTLLENVGVLVPIEAAAIQTLVRAACSGHPAAIVMAIQGRILDTNMIGQSSRPSVSQPRVAKAPPAPEPPKPEQGKATPIDPSLPDPGDEPTGDPA